MGYWQNTAENDLADGTAMSNANSSAGAAGDPFNVIKSSTATAAIKTIVTGAISGLRSYRCECAAGEFAFILIPGYSVRQMSFSVEFDCADLASVGTAVRIMQIVGATTSGVRLFIQADRTLLLQTGAGATLYTSAALPTTGKVTINLGCTSGTSSTTGTARLAYYLGSSTTPAQTAYYGTGKDTGNVDLVDARAGKIVSGTYAGPLRVDYLRLSDSSDALLGPSVATPPLAGTVAFTLSAPAPPCTLTAKITASGGTPPYTYGPVTDWGLGDGSTSPAQAGDTFTKAIPAGATVGDHNFAATLTGS